MKLYFHNADAVASGIKHVLSDLKIELASKEKADVTVDVKLSQDDTLFVSLDHQRAVISYGGAKSRFFRALSILCDWINGGIKKDELVEKPLFTTNGAMLQQTNTMRVDTIKTMFKKMALMGMNAVLFYVEDTYEIEGYPYFGYMRGRFTKKQLKELDAYANDLGVELIPCIQTLGHLASHLQWEAAAPYMDTAAVLLVGSDATYELIDAMFKTVVECFTTKRVHIGMDETSSLGTGNYYKRNGYKDRRELYFEHLEKVKDIAYSYGLEPMMWSDMFFRYAGEKLEGYSEYDERVVFTQEFKDKTPKGVRPVFWDYYRPDESFYTTNIDKHRELFEDEPIFAGGVWCWSGYCPIYSRSLPNTLPALEACRKKNVKEIFATVWSNAEHSIIVSLAGLAWYADYDYKGRFDEDSVKACFSRCCDGVSYDEMMLLELPEHPDGTTLGLTRALIFNDPLLGLVDKHIEGLNTVEYYKGVTQKLESTNGVKGIFAPAFDTITKVSSLLENKADFGVRLKAAYDSGNKDALKEFVSECDVIIEKVKALRQSHYEMWMHYNTPFEWERFDNDFGGLIARFETTKARLTDYISGKLEHIYELEQTRLRIDGKRDSDARFGSRFLWDGNAKYKSAKN